MAFPSTKEDVPRNQVHVVVEIMLMNPEVGNVDCIEQPDGKYTVRPDPRPPQ
jgi:hypothetical protein